MPHGAGEKTEEAIQEVHNRARLADEGAPSLLGCAKLVATGERGALGTRQQKPFDAAAGAGGKAAAKSATDAAAGAAGYNSAGERDVGAARQESENCEEGSGGSGGPTGVSSSSISHWSSVTPWAWGIKCTCTQNSCLGRCRGMGMGGETRRSSLGKSSLYACSCFLRDIAAAR